MGRLDTEEKYNYSHIYARRRAILGTIYIYIIV
jgi:hypothetical protein